jgi:hypothetical protein
MEGRYHERGSDDSTPQGRLYGVSAIAAQSGGGVAAMTVDLGNLAGAVAPVGGLDIVFVADPKSAVKIAAGAGPNFDFPVVASGALSAGTVIALAPLATPRINAVNLKNILG